MGITASAGLGLTQSSHRTDNVQVQKIENGYVVSYYDSSIGKQKVFCFATLDEVRTKMDEILNQQ